jgi:hypothetical protein
VGGQCVAAGGAVVEHGVAHPCAGHESVRGENGQVLADRGRADAQSCREA